ncbi:MAG: hypothetical protein Q4A00_04100 [Flavobacteriaceae bacterium]|nr:hypothetical protein [Flavobacteriaceae bacterium]
MKKILILAILGLSNFVYSQVIIQDDAGTASNKTSVLLEFSKKEKKGVLLPSVRTMPSNPTRGTILLDGSTPTNARVKYFNGQWVDLSNAQNTGGNISAHLNQQPNNINESRKKTVIGASTASADGVLVLESTTKAMVLPQVLSVNEIISPSPGMMVYLTRSKLVAFYNGAKWSFWAVKP